MKIQEKISLAPLSTFRAGGEADFFIEIRTKDDLRDAFSFISEKNIPFFCIGGGSNILFTQKGFRGVILHFRNNKISKNNENFSVESGTKIQEIYTHAKKENKDFSLFSTIPGTLGGLIAGNAGMPGGEAKDIVITAELFDIQEKKFITVANDFFEYSYRHSIFHSKNIAERYIIWSGEIALPTLPEAEIIQKAKEYLTLRKTKQPWGKTGGSFFKNPKEGAAGYFLEKAGFKGMSYGQALFSEKHANFMMNTGKATADEILELGEMAQKKVFEEFGVHLEREVKVIGER